MPTSAKQHAYALIVELHTLKVMQLGDDEIEEFRDLWRQEFGESITPEAARHRAAQLLELYSLLAQAPDRLNSANPPRDSDPHHP